MNELELRVAWERHIAPDPAALEALLDRHREAHRRYHDDRHVRWVVRHAIDLVEQQSEQVADAEAVVAAAFFHDAVYDPTQPDNEAASAALAERTLTELGWPADRAGRVAELVRATASHTAPAGDVDTAIVLAADLAVLASDPAGYAEYVNNVRAEYDHVSDADWKVGRSAVLRRFAERDSIFAPELALDAWERRARANIAAELAELNDVSGE